MKTKMLVLTCLMILFAGSAYAWPACSGNWVQVPAGTSQGTVESGGIGSVVTENGQTFQCESAAPPTSPTSPSQSQTQNQSSTSTSNSASNSSATGGTSNANASVNGSGNSSQSSTNTNKNNNVANGGTATANGGTAIASGGAGGSATSNSSASNNGNGSNNSSISSQTNVAAPTIPVATAYAPPAISTTTCFKGFGVAAQTVPFGASFGGGRIDTNCAILETARQAPNRLSRCMVYITDKYAKAAGVTLEKCMADEPVQVQPAPLPAPAPVVITVPVAQLPNPVQTPQIVHTRTIERSVLIGDCKLTPADVLSNVCKRELDSAAEVLIADSNAVLDITGPHEAAQSSVYLRTKGVGAGRIVLKLDDDQNNNIEYVVTSIETENE